MKQEKMKYDYYIILYFIYLKYDNYLLHVVLFWYLVLWLKKCFSYLKSTYFFRLIYLYQIFLHSIFHVDKQVSLLLFLFYIVVSPFYFILLYSLSFSFILLYLLSFMFFDFILFHYLYLYNIYVDCIVTYSCWERVLWRTYWTFKTLAERSLWRNVITSQRNWSRSKN